MIFTFFLISCMGNFFLTLTNFCLFQLAIRSKHLYLHVLKNSKRALFFKLYGATWNMYKYAILLPVLQTYFISTPFSVVGRAWYPGGGMACSFEPICSRNFWALHKSAFDKILADDKLIIIFSISKKEVSSSLLLVFHMIITFF